MCLSDIINSIIAIAAIFTLFSQVIQNRKSMDFAYQPEFKASLFCDCGKCKWSPKLCDGAMKNSTNKCNKDHWFILTNQGSGTAFDVEILLIHRKEINDKFKLENYMQRVHSANAILKDVDIQYKLTQNEIPHHFYNKIENDSFFIIVKYKTISKFNKFIQVIELNYRPEDKLNTQISDWKGKILFYKAKVVYFEQVGFLRRVNYKKILKSANEISNDFE